MFYQNHRPYLPINTPKPPSKRGNAEGSQRSIERKDGVPKKHDPKKWTHEYPIKKEKKLNNNIAMTSCHSNKRRERDLCKESFIWSSTIHAPHACTILISLYDLSSPWIHYLILQYMWHMCMLSFYLPWAPHKLSLEVGWKEVMLWWDVYTLNDMSDPMEK